MSSGWSSIAFPACAARRQRLAKRSVTRTSTGKYDLMCAGSNAAITIGRCRRHCSPLEEKTPPKPIWRAIAFRRGVRWKPSGRSRSTVAIASAFAITRNSRSVMRKRKYSPYLRTQSSAMRCRRAGSTSSMLPMSGSPRGPGRSRMRRVAACGFIESPPGASLALHRRVERRAGDPHHASVVGELDGFARQEAAAVDVHGLEAAAVHLDEQPVEVAVGVFALRVGAGARFARARQDANRSDHARARLEIPRPHDVRFEVAFVPSQRAAAELAQEQQGQEERRPDSHRGENSARAPLELLLGRTLRAESGPIMARRWQRRDAWRKSARK